MHITQSQLDILHAYQSGIRRYADIGAVLGRRKEAISSDLYKLARQNGIVNIKWLLKRLHEYDLSNLKPTRERNIKSGWRVGIRVSKYGRFEVYAQTGRNRRFLGSFLFRADAIEARRDFELNHGTNIP